ncbi:hypothetical protein ONZ45_g2905 [Pleurotus djamor]|nr:hypothetical protein ONZ45_g2905 [Pleurotus djamor]
MLDLREPSTNDWDEDPPWIRKPSPPPSSSATLLETKFALGPASGNSTDCAFHTDLQGAYRESSTSLSFSCLSPVFNNTNNTTLRASCDLIGLTQSFYPAIDFQHLATTALDDADNTHSNDIGTNTHTREYAYTTHESEYTNDNLFEPEESRCFIQRNTHNSTYHIHFHYHGDNYNGPIHGGIIGGRSNSNIINPVSDIETILRLIRSYGKEDLP